MSKTRLLISAMTCLALVVGSTSALADPGNGKGQGNGKNHAQGGQGQGGQGNKGKNAGGGNWSHGPDVNRGSVLGIIGNSRDYWSGGSSLPPGIQKNLARGKPLPPGIAKKLDGRLLGRLPHYDGYGSKWART